MYTVSLTKMENVKVSAKLCNALTFMFKRTTQRRKISKPTCITSVYEFFR